MSLNLNKYGGPGMYFLVKFHKFQLLGVLVIVRGNQSASPVYHPDWQDLKQMVASHWIPEGICVGV